AGVRTLRDEQMPAVRDHAERGAQPPRVLEAVCDRHHRVTCSPQHETWTADAIEMSTGILAGESLPGAPRVRVQLLRRQEPLHCPRRKRRRVRDAPAAEDEPTCGR